MPMDTTDYYYPDWRYRDDFYNHGLKNGWHGWGMGWGYRTNMLISSPKLFDLGRVNLLQVRKICLLNSIFILSARSKNLFGKDKKTGQSWVGPLLTVRQKNARIGSQPISIIRAATRSPNNKKSL